MGDQQSVKACGSIVKSGLDTVSEFADFVPLTDLDKSGAIAVFHALMPFPEFREALMNILDKVQTQKYVHNVKGMAYIGIRLSID